MMTYCDTWSSLFTINSASVQIILVIMFYLDDQLFHLNHRSLPVGHLLVTCITKSAVITAHWEYIATWTAANLLKQNESRVYGQISSMRGHVLASNRPLRVHTTISSLYVCHLTTNIWITFDISHKQKLQEILFSSNCSTFMLPFTKHLAVR